MSENPSMEKAAQDGVELHSVLEDLVPWYMSDNPVGTLDERIATHALSPSSAFTVRKTFETVQPDLDLFRGGTCQVEVLLKSGVTRDGYGDLLLINAEQTYAHVEDYKMVRLKANHKYQLMAYALGVFKEYPTVNRVCCVINSPRLDCDREPVYFGRDQIPAMVQELEDLQARVACPFSPPQPCDVCEVCRWNGLCPAQHTLADTTAQAIGYPALGRIMQAPVGPQERALRRYVADALRQYAERIREDDNAESERTGEIPLGYSRISRVNPPALKPGMNRDVIDRLLSECGVPLEVLHTYSETNLKALSTAIAEFTGEAPKTVLRGFQEKLKDLYDEGSSFSYLQKTARKPLSDLFAEVSRDRLPG